MRREDLNKYKENWLVEGFGEGVDQTPEMQENRLIIPGCVSEMNSNLKEKKYRYVIDMSETIDHLSR